MRCQVIYFLKINKFFRTFGKILTFILFIQVTCVMKLLLKLRQVIEIYTGIIALFMSLQVY